MLSSWLTAGRVSNRGSEFPDDCVNPILNVSEFKLRLRIHIVCLI